MDSSNPWLLVVVVADSLIMDCASICTFCGFTAMMVTSASAIPADGLWLTVTPYFSLRYFKRSYYNTVSECWFSQYRSWFWICKNGESSFLVSIHQEVAYSTSEPCWCHRHERCSLIVRSSCLKHSRLLQPFDLLLGCIALSTTVVVVLIVPPFSQSHVHNSPKFV